MRMAYCLIEGVFSEHKVHEVGTEDADFYMHFGKTLWALCSRLLLMLCEPTFHKAEMWGTRFMTGWDASLLREPALWGAGPVGTI